MGDSCETLTWAQQMWVHLISIYSSIPRAWYTLDTLYILLQPMDFNSLWLSDTIWWRRSGSTLAQTMASCLMAPHQYQDNCRLVVSKVWWRYYVCMSILTSLNSVPRVKISLKFVPEVPTHNHASLIWVLAWCRKATSCYLKKCWLKCLMLHGAAMPEWV